MPCICFLVLFPRLPEACPPVAFKQRAQDRLSLDPTCLKNVFILSLHRIDCLAAFGIGFVLRILKEQPQILLVSNVIAEKSNTYLLSCPLHVTYFSFCSENM